MIDINPNKQNQQTIREAISISGIGLHSGRQVDMKLVPARVDQGVKFIRSDKINNNVTIDTYEDHRMGMAFSPLSVLTNIVINDPGVVSKSYPDFWNDLTKLGITINKS